MLFSIVATLRTYFYLFAFLLTSFSLSTSLNLTINCLHTFLLVDLAFVSASTRIASSIGGDPIHLL